MPILNGARMSNWPWISKQAMPFYSPPLLTLHKPTGRFWTSPSIRVTSANPSGHAPYRANRTTQTAGSGRGPNPSRQPTHKHDQQATTITSLADVGLLREAAALNASDHAGSGTALRAADPMCKLYRPSAIAEKEPDLERARLPRRKMAIDHRAPEPIKLIKQPRSCNSIEDAAPAKPNHQSHSRTRNCKCTTPVKIWSYLAPVTGTGNTCSGRTTPRKSRCASTPLH